jgi:serine/threonine protein kinase
VARICPHPACGKRYPDDAAFCGACGSITIDEQRGSPPDARIGQRLGDYVVVARVADGAMGRVYEGRHHETRARVAIKVLHREVARDAVAVERFKREYEAVRELDSPYIVKVIAFGDTGEGVNFMIMEYLEGEVLGVILRRGESMAPARLLRMIAQLGLALDYAHSFGLIHRDLKPDNIFLCRSESGELVRLLDFGSVKLQMDSGPKLTALGTTLGSPYYMSPEQAMGKSDVDQRTDVFALGAIAYECLTGKIAFEAVNVAQILMNIINHQPVPATHVRAGLPPRIDDVLDRALHKSKVSRYPSASVFARELCEAYGVEPDIERWAQTDVRALAERLEQTVAPAARAYGTSSSMPPAAARPVSSKAPLPVVRSSGMIIGVAAIAIALVAVVTVLLMR